jgi:hypothetical protein
MYHALTVHIRVIFALVVAALSVPAAVSAQVGTADLNAVLGDLDLAVRSLPAAGAQPRLRAAVDWLATRAQASDPSTISREYLQSLQRAADLIRLQPAASALADVADELEAKVEHCRRLGIGMGGSVEVSVSTRQGGVAVGSWQVFYLLKIYEHVKGASATTFPRLSTPTEARLDPGRYWLWARDAATGRTSPRALVRIAGQPRLQVDLPVQ